MAAVFQPGSQTDRHKGQNAPQTENGLGSPLGLGDKAADAALLRERERLHDLAYLSPCALIDFVETCLNGYIPG